MFAAKSMCFVKEEEMQTKPKYKDFMLNSWQINTCGFLLLVVVGVDGFSFQTVLVS